MAGKKTAPPWRAVFLRALARTGNVRVSAREAGVDAGTAYDHRIKDEGFAARWAAVLEKVRARGPLHHASHGPRPRPGEDLVPRRSKRHGVQLVQAGEGRWSNAAEAAFFAALSSTACVRRAAAACGFSTTAIYNRRDAYPEFAAKWRAIEEQAKARLHAMLVGAGIATFDPPPGTKRGPKVSVAEAIAILRLKGTGPTVGTSQAGCVPRAPDMEAVRDEILRRVAAIRRHRAGKKAEE